MFKRVRTSFKVDRSSVVKCLYFIVYFFYKNVMPIFTLLKLLTKKILQLKGVHIDFDFKLCKYY